MSSRYIEQKREKLISSLRAKGDVSATALAHRTGLSIQFSKRVLLELEEQGLVVSREARGHNLQISLHGRGRGKKYRVYSWRNQLPLPGVT